MNKVISRDNLLFIKEVINFSFPQIGLSNPKEALWLVYGSYVINMNRASSDLDILVIHPRFTEKKRVVIDYKNVPVHLSTITMKDLEADGETRQYGSYFTGKIINPHLFLFGNKELTEEAQFHAGKFISPLVGYIATLSPVVSFNPSQITALVFVAYLSCLGPSFDLVFLNYFNSPEFAKIWKNLCRDTILILKNAGGIKRSGNKYVFTQKFVDYKSFHLERMKIAARHWSYAAVNHNNDYTFQDWLFSKAEEKKKKSDPTGEKYQKMTSFLKKRSGLSNIYI